MKRHKQVLPYCVSDEVDKVQINFQLEKLPSWQINMFRENAFDLHCFLLLWENTRGWALFLTVLGPQEPSAWLWWGPHGGWWHNHWIMCRREERHGLGDPEWWNQKEETREGPGHPWRNNFLGPHVFIKWSLQDLRSFTRLHFLKFHSLTTTSLRDHISCTLSPC